MDQIIEKLQAWITEYGLQVIAAIAILILGRIAAGATAGLHSCIDHNCFRRISTKVSGRTGLSRQGAGRQKHGTACIEGATGKWRRRHAADFCSLDPQ